MRKSPISNLYSLNGTSGKWTDASNTDQTASPQRAGPMGTNIEVNLTSTGDVRAVVLLRKLKCKEKLGAAGLGLFDDLLDGLVEGFNVDGFADETVHSNNEAGGFFGLLVVCCHRNDGGIYGRIN